MTREETRLRLLPSRPPSNTCTAPPRQIGWTFHTLTLAPFLRPAPSPKTAEPKKRGMVVREEEEEEGREEEEEEQQRSNFPFLWAAVN